VACPPGILLCTALRSALLISTADHPTTTTGGTGKIWDWWTLKTIKTFAVLRSTNSKKKIFVFRSEIPFLGCTKVRKSKFSLYQGPQIHIFPLYEGPQIRKNRCIDVRKSGVRER
jgi:hypothetical protein